MNTTYFLDRPGGRIAFDDTGGSGPLVVAVPGMGDVRGVYRFLSPLLAEHGFRFVSMDLRGHGESSTGWADYSPSAAGEDLLALVRSLDAGPAHLLGGSFGAAAVVWAAAEAPDAAASLALFGPFVRDLEMTFVQRLGMAAFTVLPGGPRLWSVYYKGLYPTTPPADLGDYRRALVTNLSEPGRWDAVRAMLRASKAEIEPRLYGVRAPTLVVMGTKDPDFGDPIGEAALVTQRTRGEQLLVEGAGHYPHAEMPAAVAGRLLSLFGETSRRG